MHIANTSGTTFYPELRNSRVREVSESIEKLLAAQILFKNENGEYQLSDFHNF